MTLPKSTKATPKIPTKTVTLRLKSTTTEIIIRNKEYEVKETDTVAMFLKRIHKEYSLKSDQSLFMYIDGSFSPALDVTFETLAKNYAVRTTGKDIIEFLCNLTPSKG
ncbi:hypothetical protein GCK72_001520 [Caenorhabditis remanei]|uniref:Ubiquitin-like protein ATG12 n=1 Tax=Caenorhabditis remanei TaxID=31234 RepID=E3N1L9_CAERE|nr:hypothetical protein GCK72_001520 [Caenorhabditis remanei]EFO83739.1 hypothetical protein CRE_14232 [Caenorhabditis remanei]KAF1769703.1 hypothetical protein GCK72_001520 [Caenorhabditis remanei]